MNRRAEDLDYVPRSTAVGGVAVSGVGDVVRFLRLLIQNIRLIGCIS
jgi:hypothetical protein